VSKFLTNLSCGDSHIKCGDKSIRFIRIFNRFLTHVVTSLISFDCTAVGCKNKGRDFTCSAAISADLHPCRRRGKVVSTNAGKVFLLMWPGDLGPLGAAEDVANMREVETSRRIFRHSAAIGRMSLSVSDSLAIRSDNSC
jgi:hypothetical protein